MKKLKYVWGKELENGRLKIFYTKNDKDQNCVLMKFGEEWKIIEDNFYARNRLKEQDLEQIYSMIKNNEIIIKEQ